jgi:hypothetical protein
MGTGLCLPCPSQCGFAYRAWRKRFRILAQPLCRFGKSLFQILKLGETPPFLHVRTPTECEHQQFTFNVVPCNSLFLLHFLTHIQLHTQIGPLAEPKKD